MVLMMKNIGTFGTVSSVGFIFSFLGVIFITAANGLLMFAMLNYVPQFQGLVNNWIAPVILAGIEGLICGTMVMSVYSFGSDTILQAYMVDLELNRPEGLRPAILQEFVESIQKP